MDGGHDVGTPPPGSKSEGRSPASPTTNTGRRYAWRRLRRSRLCGAIPDRAGDRRQVSFDCFVVDFYRRPAKLAVELDGKQREWFSGDDAGRTTILERLGVRVIRFTNAEVCTDLDPFWRGLAQSCASPSTSRALPKFESYGTLETAAFP